jgi:transposase InsO family protein
MAWLLVTQAAELAGMPGDAFHQTYRATAIFMAAPRGLEVSLESLPAALQERCRSIMPQEPTTESEPIPEPNVGTDTAVALCAPPPLDEKVSQRAEAYVKAPDYNRKHCDTRTIILRECDGLIGEDLKTYVSHRNRLNLLPPLSIGTIYRWRKAKAKGTLLANYGKRNGYSDVPDDLFDYFKRLYMVEGRPSISSCYKMVVGHAKRLGYDITTLPKQGAFMRRLKNEIPAQAVHLARNGPSANNRKYGAYVIRDYSNVLAGQCWVSDHVQLDVAATCIVDGKQSTVFPWITVMRDFKSGLWVGWYAHPEPPNSDHIFAAFYLAAVAHGVPSTLYLDNGKDYRCKEFSGGRPEKIKVSIDMTATTSMCAQLNIDVIFANPYNAQAKPIERDFLTNKFLFSMHNPGYRGGNVVERPECLEQKIKSGQIASFDEVIRVFDRHIREVMMVLPVESKHSFRCGKSPVSMWNAEYEEAKRRGLTHDVSKAALAMFCHRVSKVKTIGRNGIKDSEILTTYYADWMEDYVGRKVYLRRAPGVVEEAWVFDAERHSLLGLAAWIEPAPALITNEGDRQKLSKNLERVKKSKKIGKLLSKVGPEVSAEEKVEDMAAYAKSVNPNAEIVPISASQTPTILTPMDTELHKYKKRSEESGPDIEALARVNAQIVPSQKKPLIRFEWELEELEADNAVANAG